MATRKDNGPGEIDYCVVPTHPTTPAESYNNLPAENDTHLEEMGEREDAAGYNVYHGPAQSGQRSTSGD